MINLEEKPWNRSVVHGYDVGVNLKVKLLLQVDIICYGLVERTAYNFSWPDEEWTFRCDKDLPQKILLNSPGGSLSYIHSCGQAHSSIPRYLSLACYLPLSSGQHVQSPRLRQLDVTV